MTLSLPADTHEAAHLLEQWVMQHRGARLKRGLVQALSHRNPEEIDAIMRHLKVRGETSRQTGAIHRIWITVAHETENPFLTNLKTICHNILHGGTLPQ